MTFGTEETVRCLQDLQAPGPKGEDVCLGHKLTVYHFIAPVGLSDDGYVLGVKGTNHYYSLPAAGIPKMQASGALPTPMPPYALSKGDYIWGYFLWILLALMIPVVIAKTIKSRRYRVQQNQVGASQSGPLTIGTEEDRFIAAQVALQLRPRERVSHQACVRSDVVVGALVTLGAKAHFAVLTDQRLLLIETRTSLFGVRRENRGIESIERSAIKVVLAGPDGALGIAFNDGTTRVLVVDPKRRGFSNQSAFLLDLPRLFPAAEVAAADTTAAAPS